MKKYHFKITSFIVVFIMLIAFLAGCNNNEETDTSKTASSEDSQNSEFSDIFLTAEDSSEFSNNSESNASIESNETNVSNLDDINKISKNEFFNSVKYMQLQSNAFEFISAHIRGDYDSAMEVVADSSVISKYFPTEKRSMDDMRGYFIVDVWLGSKKIGGIITESASLIISVYFKDEAGAFDFHIDMEYRDFTHVINEEEYISKRWEVIDYYLDT